MAAMKALLDASVEQGMTEAQAAALLALCERYGVGYDPAHYRPGGFGLPAACPRCLRTSYNPDDAREGYCGNCRDWTSPPPPDLETP